MPTPPSDRDVRRATILCFAVPFGLYALTAARTVQGGDAGEFGVIGMLGGVAHPPGYPLYVLLSRIMSHLPFGPPFWRIAMGSALCGAAAGAVLFRVALRQTGHLSAALVAAMAFALSPLEWRLSGIPEVFSLHALACATTLLFSLRLADAPPERVAREALALGLTLGLGFANHQTIILLAPVVLWAVVAAALRSSLGQVGLAALLGTAGALLGLSAYLLLPLFAHWATPTSYVWGRVDTWGGFVTHVLRREYGTFRLGATAGEPEPARHVLFFLRSLPGEYVYVFFLSGLVGVVAAFQKRAGFALALLTSFLLAGVAFTALFNTTDTHINSDVTRRFHLMPNLLFAVFVAAGAAELAPRMRPRLAGGLAAATLLTGAIIAGREADWAGDTSIERFMIAEVAAAAPNAVILGVADTNEPGITWASRVVGNRPDVHFINLALYQPGTWYFERLQAELPGVSLPALPGRPPPGLLGLRIGAFTPTYVIPWIAAEAEETASLQPDGFLEQVVPQGTPRLPLAEAEARLNRATATFGHQPPALDAWAEMVHIAAGSSWLKLAEAYRVAGQPDKARALNERACTILPADECDGR